MLADIITQFELHDPEGIRRCLASGLEANSLCEGKPLVYQLINMYSRGPRFRECMQVMQDFGATVEDPALQAVLLDDAAGLESWIVQEPGALTRRYQLNCTFTPLYEASLLHICTEYGHRNCAGVLVQYGADVNARAGVDPDGFGGHTPLFHAVNQHRNVNIDMLDFLLAQGAHTDLTVTGLIWGRGYEWETYIPSVNPISYAMMGLLRQFQRTEADVYTVVERLMKARYDLSYQPSNVPNRYLSQG